MPSIIKRCDTLGGEYMNNEERNCACFGNIPAHVSMPCKNFQDDDHGDCLECGHRRDCHAESNRTTEQLASAPLTAEAARAKCEEAADVLASQHGGFWHWIDEKRVRVYKPDGAPFATLHMEPLQ